MRLLIREIREKKNMSISKLSKLTGISRSMLYYIEKNQKKPSFETVYKISVALDTNMYEFIAKEIV
ncbi:MAG: helix-turn-helix transcriptional regulator [Vallitalea sp.]|jgi:transcriptional regulator with XRE-family HTH domain|nr:helix-turn-helix transcriptional regulator [Vallitalea sp.]